MGNLLTGGPIRFANPRDYKFKEISISLESQAREIRMLRNFEIILDRNSSRSLFLNGIRIVDSSDIRNSYYHKNLHYI